MHDSPSKIRDHKGNSAVGDKHGYVTKRFCIFNILFTEKK